jgi:pimeloyl-ACP methyl ester carboxylesterase
MTGNWVSRHLLTATVGTIMVVGTLVVVWQFRTDIAAARNRIATGSTVMQAPCGAIEYADTGTGMPLLAVHGSGGGYDQGMAFAAPLTARGIRVIAVSRFGYLRSPMPGNGSAEAQADAFVCLLDGLGIGRVAIMGGSAGAPSALAMTINHPDRVSALILVAPLAYKPPTETNSAAPMAPWVETTMMTVLGSDFLFWSAAHLFRNQVMAKVLATPPALMDTVSGAEQARANAMLDSILPISARIAGLSADTAASKSLSPSQLDLITAPTLIISARDDGYGTYASAEYNAAGIAGAHFMGFDTGGHVWLGHNDAVMDAIADLLLTPEQAAER